MDSSIIDNSTYEVVPYSGFDNQTMSKTIAA